MENNSFEPQQDTEKDSAAINEASSVTETAAPQSTNSAQPQNTQTAPKKKSKIPLIIIIAALVAGLGTGGFFAYRHFSDKDSDSKKKDEKEKNTEIIDITDYDADASEEIEYEVPDFDGPDESVLTQLGHGLDENGDFSLLSGDFDTTIASSDDALSFIAAYSDTIGITNAQNELSLINENTINDITYYKFQQVVNDIPVYGNQLILSVGSDGVADTISGGFTPISVNTTPDISKGQAEDFVKSSLGTDASLLSSELTILPHTDAGDAKLVYKIDAVNSEESNEYFIDASNCTVISTYSLLSGVSEVIDAKVDDNVFNVELEKTLVGYDLYDPTRDITVSDAGAVTMFSGVIKDMLHLKFNPLSISQIDDNADGTKTVKVEPSLDFWDLIPPIFTAYSKIEEILSVPKLSAYSLGSLNSFETTYDYYNTNLGWKSIDGNGMPLQVVVGVKDAVCNKGMTDNELISLLHLIGACTPGLKDVENAAYVNDTNLFLIGAVEGKPLNGKGILAHEFTHGVVHYTANLSKDVSSRTIDEGYADTMASIITGDWAFIAKEVPTDWENYNYMVRDAADPNKYSAPAIKDSSDPYYNASPTDEHQNATIVSHSAYLMSQYGLSNDKIGKLFFNSLFEITGYVNFNETANALIHTAGSLGYTKEEQQAVARALIETKMLDTDEGVPVHVHCGTHSIPDAEIYIGGEKVGTTDENGDIILDIDYTLFGGFEMEVKADGFDSLSSIILNINYCTEMDFNLSVNEDFGKTHGSDEEKAGEKSEDMVTVTIMDMSAEASGKKSSSKGTGQDYHVMSGSKISLQKLIDSMNAAETKEMKKLKKELGMEDITTDGTKIYINTTFGSVELAYYDYETGELFDFSKPIYKDVVIEPRTSLGDISIGMDGILGADVEGFEFGDYKFDLDLNGKDLEETAKELDRFFNHGGKS